MLILNTIYKTWKGIYDLNKQSRRGKMQKKDVELSVCFPQRWFYMCITFSLIIHVFHHCMICVEE